MLLAFLGHFLSYEMEVTVILNGVLKELMRQMSGREPAWFVGDVCVCVWLARGRLLYYFSSLWAFIHFLYHLFF